MENIVFYDSNKRSIYFSPEGENEKVEVFQDASFEEFREVEEIESYLHKCMSTPNRLLYTLEKAPLFSSMAKKELRRLRKDIISLYNGFERHKSLAEVSDFERVRGYRKTIYKVKRPLENIFQCIGVVGDFITNSDIFTKIKQNKHSEKNIKYLVMNTCSAVEHLGIIAVNRLIPESGGINPDAPQYNVEKVYERIIQYDLDKPIREEDSNLTTSISLAGVKQFKKMRDILGHKSVMIGDSSQNVPDGLRSEVYLYDESTMKNIIKIAFNLHKISLIVLTNFVHDHLKANIEPYVEALYQDQ